MLAKVFLRVGMRHGHAGTFPLKVGGVQVLADLAPSSQIVGSSLRTLWLAKQNNIKHSGKVLLP